MNNLTLAQYNTANGMSVDKLPQEQKIEYAKWIIRVYEENKDLITNKEKVKYEEALEIIEGLK